MKSLKSFKRLVWRANPSQERGRGWPTRLVKDMILYRLYYSINDWFWMCGIDFGSPFVVYPGTVWVANYSQILSFGYQPTFALNNELSCLPACICSEASEMGNSRDSQEYLYLFFSDTNTQPGNHNLKSRACMVLLQTKNESQTDPELSSQCTCTHEWGSPFS